MLKKIVICSESDEKLSLYKSYLSDINILDFMKMESPDFVASDYFDIRTLPTTFVGEFGSIPMDLDCQILDTKGKGRWHGLVTTVPNFRDSGGNLSELERSIYNFTIPLKKVIEYSIENNVDIVYGILDEFSFIAEVEVNEHVLDMVKNALIDILKKYDMM